VGVKQLGVAVFSVVAPTFVALIVCPKQINSAPEQSSLDGCAKVFIEKMKKHKNKKTIFFVFDISALRIIS
jgi:hypothetical protein